jgi:flagellar motor switch protein FliG
MSRPRKGDIMMIFTFIPFMFGLSIGSALAAGPSTLEVKKRGEQQVRQVLEPLVNQYCREQCQLIHVETEVDLAVDDLTAPGFEEGGRATLAPAAARVRILVDENLGSQTRMKILSLFKEHLKQMDFPVEFDAILTQFPQPASSAYKVADLRARVVRDIRTSIQGMLTQFCPEHCVLGEFDVQTEIVNPEDVDYAASQEYFQDGPAAIRVKGVKAVVMTDQALPPEEAAGMVEMVKLKVSPYRNSEVLTQSMRFPKNLQMMAGGQIPWAQGRSPAAAGKEHSGKEEKESRELKDQRELREARDSRETRESRELKDSTESRSQKQTVSQQNDSSDVRKERIEHYEKIERVENGDAVQAVLDKFKLYGIVLSAIILALLFTLVAISFRKQVFDGGKGQDGGKDSNRDGKSATATPDNLSLTNDEKATLIGKRIEASRLQDELTAIYSEQPKVAKHVFTHVLTEEGVETTAQYLEIFGESVVMDLLRDPGLQSDLAELMDFYARNTFDINDDERLGLLKKLHHRTVTAKMQVHGSRSAVLFDFLAEMDAPQMFEMIKNESNTVKAIVLTQCDSKRRQVLFQSYDEQTQLKLMAELSRIDHLPKNYIHNVASALRRKKLENPKLNTEALPGTDVLVSFLERSSMDAQRNIIQQLMATSGGEALHSLKSKLVSVETLRYLKDVVLTEIITSVKHDELVQFLKGCGDEIRNSILNKVPRDLGDDLSEELVMAEPVSREVFAVVERKVLNRIKTMANSGQINLSDVNDRIFAEQFGYDQREVTSTDLRRYG